MNIKNENGTIDIKTLKMILIIIIIILNLIFWGLIVFAYSSKANIHDTTKNAQQTLDLMTTNVKFKEFEGTGKTGKEIRTLKNIVNIHNKSNYKQVTLKCPSQIKDDKKYTVRIKYSWFGEVERITVKIEG